MTILHLFLAPYRLTAQGFWTGLALLGFVTVRRVSLAKRATLPFSPLLLDPLPPRYPVPIRRLFVIVQWPGPALSSYSPP